MATLSYPCGVARIFKSDFNSGDSDLNEVENKIAENILYSQLLIIH